ncbi:Ppx/GppA phosphatase family protein [Solicola gregarius]|uniref:Ppx/GppA family phosphatase n=1 Tax=Solicola gregarius TaxID=2908642 RepID=A0AA46TKC9_9ACTN|nr:Ppx/GppA phosphatase family protein [Solicola gregarius]UYM06499.1 Ppx/GppA family phosphatase [Solicola gregarius]
MTRVAAIDCGTNSIRLLIADLDAASGTQLDQVREVQIVRLGQGVDRTGRLDDEAVARTLAVCSEYAETCRAYAVEAIRFCATSAARDADNATEFRASVRELLGVDVEVLSGDEEAALAYDGVVRVAGDLATPILVADVGGGSTELILGDASGVLAARSLDIGSVRMTERHLRTDPPTAAEVAEASSDVDRAVRSSQVPIGDAATVVGVAGTCTNIAAYTLGLTAYERDRVHLARFDRGDVVVSCIELLHMTVERRRAIPFMHPGRADVIGGGAQIVERLLANVEATVPFVVSEHDILDGIAWSVARPLG